MPIAEILSKVVLPISLAIIMLSMGLNLVLNDFFLIVKKPRPIFIGLVNQLILLPIIGFVLAITFDLNPIWSIGLIILASCPGGPPSNFITYACKGNVAISVALTAISSFISVLSIPFILQFAVTFFEGNSGQSFQVPLMDTVIQIVVITVIPISFGMVIRKFIPDFAYQIQKVMTKVASFVFVAVLIAVLFLNGEIIITAMKKVAFVTFLLNVTTMALGYLTSVLFKLNKETAISITLETGIQNGALAFVIATTFFNNVEMAMPTAAYVIWMYLTSGVFVWYLRVKRTVKPVRVK